MIKVPYKSVGSRDLTGGISNALNNAYNRLNESANAKVAAERQARLDDRNTELFNMRVAEVEDAKAREARGQAAQKAIAGIQTESDEMAKLDLNAGKRKEIAASNQQITAGNVSAQEKLEDKYTDDLFAALKAEDDAIYATKPDAQPVTGLGSGGDLNNYYMLEGRLEDMVANPTTNNIGQSQIIREELENSVIGKQVKSLRDQINFQANRTDIPSDQKDEILKQLSMRLNPTANYNRQDDVNESKVAALKAKQVREALENTTVGKAATEELLALPEKNIQDVRTGRKVQMSQADYLKEVNKIAAKNDLTPKETKELLANALVQYPAVKEVSLGDQIRASKYRDEKQTLSAIKANNLKYKDYASLDAVLKDMKLTNTVKGKDSKISKGYDAINKNITTEKYGSDAVDVLSVSNAFQQLGIDSSVVANIIQQEELRTVLGTDLLKDNKVTFDDFNSIKVVDPRTGNTLGLGDAAKKAQAGGMQIINKNGKLELVSK